MKKETKEQVLGTGTGSAVSAGIGASLIGKMGVVAKGGAIAFGLNAAIPAAIVGAGVGYFGIKIYQKIKAKKK